MEIIVYGSQYGTTKKYAQKLSEKTGINAVNYSDIGDINQYDTIIYFGALYAGSLLGMKKTLNKISDATNKKIIIATVGLVDPNDDSNRNAIREKIKKQLSDDVYGIVNIYFLKGGIDYSSLNLKHKTMMAFAYRNAKRLKEEEQTAESKVIVETYGKKISFIDFDALNPIIDEIN